MVTVVDCQPDHLPEVAAIYAHAAQTPATFDLEGRPLEWWRAALEATDERAGHVMLVALADDDGEVLGYAKTGRFRDRAAYDTTVEVGVYVREDARGRGVGDALYAVLIARLEASDALMAVAGITEPNDASVRLHTRHGFTPVGTFHRVGLKMGREWDVSFYERPLGGGAA